MNTAGKISVLGIAVLCIFQTPAATIINFTGGTDGNTGSTAPALTFTDWAVQGADHVRHMEYSTTALNAPPTLGDGLPPLFGAAYHVSNGGGAAEAEPTFPTSILTGGGAQPNRLSVSGSRDSGFTHTQRLLLMVGKANFLDLQDAPAVTFGTGDVLTINSVVSTNNNPQYVHLVIQDDNDWYISQTHVTGSGTLTFTDPNSANWIAFDPDAATNFGGTNYSQHIGAPHTFTDVQGVGFFVQNTWTGTGSGQGSIVLRNFEVTAIPEPGTLLLSLLAFGSLSLFAHRKHR